jgi:hypothetical protein
VEVLIGVREDVLSLPNSAIRTPDEARQLVTALGMDPELLEARVPSDEDADAKEPPEADAEEPETTEDGLPTMAALQAMSREERMELIQNLEPGQRQKLFAMFQQIREQREQASRGDPSAPKDAFVFVDDEQGLLTLKPIRIGLSSWEFTEVLGGLEEGQPVVQVPMALVQQSEFLERIRSRTSIPGVSRS